MCVELTRFIWGGDRAASPGAAERKQSVRPFSGRRRAGSGSAYQLLPTEKASAGHRDTASFFRLFLNSISACQNYLKIKENILKKVQKLIKHRFQIVCTFWHDLEHRFF